jgi:histidyl-tRNA synthetase
MSDSKKSIQDILQAPKGMRDIKQDEFYAFDVFSKNAQAIAESYGFSGISTPIVEHTEVFNKGLDADDDAIKEMYSFSTKGGDMLSLRPEGTAAIMRSYIEHGMGSLPQPVFLYYQGPFFRHEKPQKGRYRQLHQFGLEIIGSPKPIFDAITIQTGYRILCTLGKKIKVQINTLGDKENRIAYLELLRAYYQQHIDALGEQDRQRLATNPLRILDSKDRATIEVNKHAPDILDTLNEASKQHFDAVCSYLNEADIPYTIDHSLVRGLDYYSHTVFEFVTEDNEEGEKQLALGGGGRYDGLAQAMGHNKHVPGIGLGLGLDRIIDIADHGDLIKRLSNQPLCSFIQLDSALGVKARMIIDSLRSSDIPVHYRFSKDGLSAQLSRVEEQDIRYALIYGEQEDQQHTITVRNMKERSQKEVALDDLVSYLSSCE